MATYTPNLTFTSGENASSTKINELINNMLAIFPVGSLVYIHQTPTTTETTFMGKWIQCNGTLVSTTTYASLFAVVGTAYGSGSGTFGLPDLRGRLPVSIGSHADVSAFGKNDGAAIGSRRLKHAHTFANGSHGHSVSATAEPSGDHIHSLSVAVVGGSAEQTGSDDDLISSSAQGYNTGSGGTVHGHTLSGWSSAGATSVSQIGIAGTTTDQPGYICAGCWYMAYA